MLQDGAGQVGGVLPLTFHVGACALINTYNTTLHIVMLKQAWLTSDARNKRLSPIGPHVDMRLVPRQPRGRPTLGSSYP